MIALFSIMYEIILALWTKHKPSELTTARRNGWQLCSDRLPGMIKNSVSFCNRSSGQFVNDNVRCLNGQSEFQMLVKREMFCNK